MNEKFFSVLGIISFVFCLTSGVLFAPADAGNVGNVVITGTINLATFNISVSGIGSDNATITWKTNGNANSVVEYGTTTGYGSTSTDTVMLPTHTVGLYSLTPHTTYHYRVKSTTIDELSATSADANFTTLYSTGTTVSTQTQGTTFSGIASTTTAGVQQINLTHSTLTGTTSVSGNTVTVSNPGNGWSSLKYTGTVQEDAGQNISISNVQSVVMESSPVTADLGGNIGEISTQISVPLMQLVTGTSLQQNVIAGATSSTNSAFQLAAANSNLDIKSVAYTVEFTNTESLNANLGGDGVTLNLGIDHAWVEANGGRDTIRILRFGNDGRNEVLTTQYTSSTGPTDYFRATSPHGLSVFGMTAVTSPSGEGETNGGSTGGGTSDGGDTGGGFGGFLESFFGNLPEAPEAPVEVVQPGPVQQGPLEKNATTVTRSLAVAGLMVTTGSGGTQNLLLDTTRARASGSTISLQDNIITISQNGFTLIVDTSEMAVKGNGVISGTVRSVRLCTTPVYATTNVGIGSISINTPLEAIPENASITITIPETVNQQVQDAFRTAAQSNNQEITGIAYRVYIGKNNLAAPGPARVNLTISPDWVASNGGIPSIGIMHIADEGTSTMLTTTYAGSDDTGNLIFEGSSPQGLSTFGLVSLKKLTEPTQMPVTSQTPAPVSPSKSIREHLQNLAGGSLQHLVNNIILVIGGCIIMLALGTGVILYFNRPGKKNPRKKKKEQ